MTTYAIKVQNTMRSTNPRYSTEGPMTLYYYIGKNGWMSLDENGKEIFGDNGMIRCTQCGIRTRETKECDVIEAWNRRIDNG